MSGMRGTKHRMGSTFTDDAAARRQRRPRRRRTAALVLGIALALVLVLGIAPVAMAAGTAGDPPVQFFYVPFPEAQLLLGLQTIASGGSGATPADPMQTYISIAAVANDTVIYYDQHENGYEASISAPADVWASPGNLDGTQIWGDANAANGAPPGIPGDVINAGTVIILNNAVTSTSPGTIDFDGRDKFAASKNVAVTRTGWASGSNSLLAGSLEVFDTGFWGTDYRAPVGENIPDTGILVPQTPLYVFPTSDAANGNWSGYTNDTPANPRYDKIDEVTHDSDATHIRSSGTTAYQAGVPSPGLPAGATNISVSVIWTGREGVVTGQTVTAGLLVGGNTYNGTARNLPAAYTTYTETWIENPATNDPWTVTDVNNDLDGLGFDASGTNQQRVTQGYIRIDYSLPNGDFQMFEYTGLAIMAGAAGATISVDVNADGDYTDPGDVNGEILSEGQSRLVNGGVNVGAHVISSNPVQVDILTGDRGSNYESRDSALLPVPSWSSNYYTPVSTPAGGTGDARTTVWLYNPGLSDITVTYQRRDNGGTLITSNITVPAGSYNKQILDQPTGGTGSRFFTAGAEPFYGFSTTDSASSTFSNNQAWDWGFSLIPESALTPQALVGLGIGRDPTSGTNLTENGNPVWVTTVGNGTTPVTVYVDYDGDNLGALTDPNGFKYDVSYSLTELQQQKIYDPDRDQTGMLVYVLAPNTRLAVAWGQDPTTATAGAPGLDVGTSVPPIPLFQPAKMAALSTDLGDDVNGNGFLEPGDVILYTITIVNISRGTITNLQLQDTLFDGRELRSFDYEQAIWRRTDHGDPG